MVDNSTREFFTTIVQASAGLTGLLFVAMSVARQRVSPKMVVVQQVRAAAALFMFTSALSISLFALVRDNNVRYPALIVGVVGVSFSAAGARSILDSSQDRRELRHQLNLMVLMFLTFGSEVFCGILLIINSHDGAAMDYLQNVLAASLLVGIGRSWGLAGERDTGIVASIAVLMGKSKAVLPLGSDDDVPPSVHDDGA
jgi:hypothetical protein